MGCSVKHCHGATGAGDGGSITSNLFCIPHYNDEKLLRRAGVANE